MVLVGAFALVNGDAYRVINGVDSFGNTCGRRNTPVVIFKNSSFDERFPLSGQDMTSKPFLFPLDASHPMTSAWICVENCPSRTVADRYDEFHASTNYSYCSGWVTSENLRRRRFCPIGTIYKSSGSVLSRCVPDEFLDVAVNMITPLSDFIQQNDWAREVANELISVRFEIAMFCAVSVGASLIMVFLIRFLAPVIVYFIYISVVLIAAGISVALWYLWFIIRNAAANKDQTKAEESFLGLQSASSNTVIALAITASIMTVFLIFAISCLWPRGALVIDLFRETGRALGSVPCLFFQPLFTCLVLCFVIVVWTAVSVFLLTSTPGVPTVLNQSNGELIEVVTFNLTIQVRYMWYYHLAGLIWITEFIFASHRIVTAGAVALWYFERKNMPYYFCRALSNLILYHLGSVAFGSFIITMVKLPRYIFLYCLARLKASDGFLAKFACGCLVSVLGCFEKCLKYLHHNAYTVIAISGKSFCPASKMAVNILLDSAVDVATINTVGDFVLFLAKCIVTALVAAAAAFRFKRHLVLEYWAVCTGVAAIFAYFIASCFMAVVEMTIDTLFLCFAEDSSNVSRSNGTADYTDVHFKDYIDSALCRERALSGSRRRTKKENPERLEVVPLSEVISSNR